MLLCIATYRCLCGRVFLSLGLTPRSEITGIVHFEGMFSKTAALQVLPAVNEDSTCFVFLPTSLVFTVRYAELGFPLALVERQMEWNEGNRYYSCRKRVLSPAVRCFSWGALSSVSKITCYRRLFNEALSISQEIGGLIFATRHSCFACLGYVLFYAFYFYWHNFFPSPDACRIIF